MIPNPIQKRKISCNMSLWEIITIMVMFQLSNYHMFNSKDFLKMDLLARNLLYALLIKVWN